MRLSPVSLVLATAFLLLAQPLQAGNGTMRYEVPDLQNMTDFLFANGYIDPNDPKQLSDYVIIKDCQLYLDYYKQDFFWNRIRNRIREDAKSLKNDVVTHFILPNTIFVDRYNFTTKAFDIVSSSQLRNVNIIQMNEDKPAPCRNALVNGAVNNLPHTYEMKLETPLSLYRIPMAEDMGRRILADMVKLPKEVGGGRIFYALVYVTADSVLDMVSGNRAMLLGRVEKIEFFLDQSRTQKFKTLYYSDL